MLGIREFASYYKEERGWTEAFEQAVARLSEEGGGTLVVTPGRHETYSIELKSNITLQVEAGAEICFQQDWQGYQEVRSEYEGKSTGMFMPCIYARDAENVTLCGQGTLNGQGEYWWKNLGKFPAARPYLVCFERCSRVKVLDVKLVQSPVWTLHPLYCEDVEIRGVTIRNPWDSPNTDGINPDGCCNVRIADCLVDVGDDCITLKSGTEETPKKRPCENITITNCNMVHGHGGVVIGSEMSGGVRNVTITNCVFQDTDRGIRVKTRRGRGGSMESILVSNVIMDRVLCPFVFNMYYRCGMNGGSYKDKFAHEVTEATPMIRNIQIQNCMVTDAKAAAGFFYGLPEMPVENVSISDCTIRMSREAQPGCPGMMEDLDPMSGEGIYMRNATKVRFRNVKVLGYQGEGEGREPWNVDESVEWEAE